MVCLIEGVITLWMAHGVPHGESNNFLGGPWCASSINLKWMVNGFKSRMEMTACITYMRLNRPSLLAGWRVSMPETLAGFVVSL